MPTDVRQGSPKQNSASPGFAEQSLGTCSQEGLLALARRNEMMACASEESQAMGRLATDAHNLKGQISQLFSGTTSLSFFLIVAASLKMAFPKRVPFFPGLR